MLNEIIVAEAARRAALKASNNWVTHQRDAFVKALHCAIEPDLESLYDLKLIGDYGRPVGFGGGRKDSICGSGGITIPLGSRISPERLVLSVLAPDNDVGEFRYQLQHCRDYPYKSDPAIEFWVGTTPADTVVGQLMKLLVPHIHMGD